MAGIDLDVVADSLVDQLRLGGGHPRDPVAPGGHTVLTGAQFDRLQQVATATMNRNTVTPATFMAQLYRWLTAHGYTQVVTYQPASRFWLFQGIEAAICVAAALTALAVAYRLVTRRTT